MANLESLVPSDLIGSQLTITLNTKPEHRELTGVLLALDNKPNLLLQNVIEVTKQTADAKEQNRRDLGLVSVPANTIESVRVVTSELEKIAHHKSLVI